MIRRITADARSRADHFAASETRRTVETGDAIESTAAPEISGSECVDRFDVRRAEALEYASDHIQIIDWGSRSGSERSDPVATNPASTSTKPAALPRM